MNRIQFKQIKPNNDWAELKDTKRELAYLLEQGFMEASRRWQVSNPKFIDTLKKNLRAQFESLDIYRAVTHSKRDTFSVTVFRITRAVVIMCRHKVLTVYID